MQKAKTCEIFRAILFMDSLFTEAVTCFLIPHLNKSKLIYRSSHYIKIPKKTIWIICLSKEFNFRKFVPWPQISKANHFVDLRRFSASWKRAKQLLTRSIFVDWYVLTMSWRRLGDAFPTFWRRINKIIVTWVARLDNVLETS